MFRPVRFQNNIVGHEFADNGELFFFGTKNCTRELLPQLYSHLNFCFLRQVHGAEIVAANPEAVTTADGHFTRERGQALVIQTADCLPILFGGAGVVLGLHAGWRGLAQKITAAAVPHGPFQRALIGPHIRVASFEVGNDVAEQLAKEHPDVVSGHPQPEKKYVDLDRLARRQLRGLWGEDFAVTTLAGDTFSSPLYHSFRRGKDRAARQYSFVALV